LVSAAGRMARGLDGHTRIGHLLGPPKGPPSRMVGLTKWPRNESTLTGVTGLAALGALSVPISIVGWGLRTRRSANR
jgi:hypothetical protein